MTNGKSSSSFAWAAPFAILVSLIASACSEPKEPVPFQGGVGKPSAPPVTAVTEFDPANFSDPTRIDNKYLPFKPGTVLTDQGSAYEGKKRVEHSQVLTVTDLTKQIAGVRTVAVWTTYYNEGKFAEDELAFYAQDDVGNVWYFGEYPEEFDGGKFTGAPDTWFAGLEKAKPGIFMRAAPATGQPAYLQGFAPEIEFADRAKVFQTGQKTCVPVSCYQNVLVTEEWNPDEPGRFQLKYYAAGIGEVRVGWRGSKETEKEILELSKVEHLTGAALAAVRDRALKLEERAYKVSKVYRQTPPAEQPAA
ncbi:MAG TPA: hypothetical protein VF660_00065 [Actinomycetota bacterium]|jgi:hypothetical protein